MSPAPQLAPVRSRERASPLLPWAAGALLSGLVLVLTVSDQGWLDSLTSGSPTGADPAVVIGPIEEVPPPAAQPAAAMSDKAFAPPARGSPRVVPISPDGRGTALPGAGAPAGPVGVPSRGDAPGTSTADAPRVVPISLERPQPALLPGVQMIGAGAGEAVAPVELVDLRHDATVSAPEGPADGTVRVFIHYQRARADDAATAARLAEYLDRRGFEVAAIRPIEIPIGSADVRYFFERDRAEARRLLEDLGWFFRGSPQRSPDQASDFTHYTPRPHPGIVEIWLPAAS